MGILCIADRLLHFFVWRIGGFCSQGVLPCLFYMCSQISLVLVETARTVETSPSFLAHIGRNRQSLLYVGFFVVGLPVGVCGFFGHINHSIGHNRLRNEFGFGLT